MSPTYEIVIKLIDKIILKYGGANPDLARDLFELRRALEAAQLKKDWVAAANLLAKIVLLIKWFLGE